MEKFVEYFKLIIASISSLIGWFFGGLDGFVYVLIALATIDYISGVMCAMVEKKLSSRVGFKGLFHKVLMFALVGIGNLIDVYVIHSGSVLRTALVFYYIANEGLSILENAVRLGLPVPEKLREVLIQIKNKGEDKDECTE